MLLRNNMAESGEIAIIEKTSGDEEKRNPASCADAAT
jgi:hypothetical protein